MNSPRVLVRGTGSIGARHLRVLREQLGVEDLYALPVHRVREACVELGNAEVVDLERASSLSLDACIVATDTSRHLADACEALAWGADVLVEKPLAPSLAGVGELVTLLQRCSGRHVFVAAPLRFQRALQAFRAALGRVGVTHAIRIECVSYLPSWRPDRPYRESYSARLGEGGVLLDLVHEIDYALWCFGLPSRVWARIGDGTRLGIETEAQAELTWETPAGALLSMRLDYLTRNARRRIIVDGDAGTLIWDGLAQVVTFTDANGQVDLREFPEARDDSLASQSRAFLAAISGGDPGPLPSVDEGIDALAVIDAARRSAESGSWQAMQRMTS